MAKSKTKYYEFTGTVSYCMCYKPDEYRGKRFWKVNLHPDEKTKKAIESAGIQLEFKTRKPIEGVDGGYFSFRRYTERDFNGETTRFSPPEVRDAKGNPIVSYDADGNRIGDPVLIGNGTKAKIGVEVYDAGSFGKGCRWNFVQIIDLVEYERPEEVPEESEREEPKETPAKAAKEPSKKVAW